MIAIAGGGLAGLSAAYHLEDPDWIMFEKSDRVGGLCKSETTKDGFTFDYGTHRFYTKDSYVRGLWEKLLGDNREERTRRSWVYSHGVYTRYPFQANLHGLPMDVVRECLVGLIDAIFRKKVSPNDFEEWIHTTFGRGIAKHFLLPYNKKMWTVDAAKMGCEWAEGRVLTPDLRRAIDGALRGIPDSMGPNAIYEYPKKGGIEALPRGFLDYIDENKICCKAEIVEIDWREKEFIMGDFMDSALMNYDKMIYTLPLPLLSSLLVPEPPELVKKALGRLECNKVHCINYEIEKDSVTRDTVYVPEYNLLPHRICYPLDKSPTLAPKGRGSVSAEVATSKHKAITEGDWLIGGVEADLERMGVTGLEFKSLLTLDPAYVIYTKTHRKDVDVIHSFLRENDIYPCGRFGDWEYYNMDKTILSGRRAAMEVKQ